MNRIDEFLHLKLIEKKQSNHYYDNSVITIFKNSNKIIIKDEAIILERTSDRRTLESRLNRLLVSEKIERYEKQGDGKTFKIFLPRKFRKNVSSDQLPLF